MHHKIKNIIYLSAVALLVSINFSCSSETSYNAENDNVSSAADISISGEDNSGPVVSRKAYNRGLAIGRQIDSLPHGSRQREHALIEVHATISALQRNGYPQTAADFSKGVTAALHP